MSWGVYDYPEPRGGKVPSCPICGKECSTIYRNRDYEIVGCDECITAVAAEDVGECYDTE